MEIFPSLDRNRKTTLFTRPSSRFLSRERRARPRPPVEDAGHVQHGAITRSFRFFHLLDPLLVSFQPNFNGKPSGRGTFFLLVFKTATRRKSSTKIGAPARLKLKRVNVLLSFSFQPHLKPFSIFRISTFISFLLPPSCRALSKRTGSERRARFERIFERGDGRTRYVRFS